MTRLAAGMAGKNWWARQNPNAGQLLEKAADGRVDTNKHTIERLPETGRQISKNTGRLE
jgi:hypothetical protein